MKRIQVKDYNKKDFPQLLLKEVYIFPLLDGLKTSIWMDKHGILHMEDAEGEIYLTEKETIRNKIYIYALNSLSLNKFLKENQIIEKNKIIQEFIIEGVWLYPQNNTIYDKKYLKHFFITDVVKKIKTYNRNLQEDIHLYSYQNYFSYKTQLERYKLNYVSLIEKKKVTEDELKIYANHNLLYIQRGNLYGPGIIIKDYNYCMNGKQIFARVKSEYYKG